VLGTSRLFYDTVCAPKHECKEVPLEELYDLDADPFEERNLLLAPLATDAAAALARLRGELERHRNLPHDYRLAALTGQARAGSTAKADESTKEALRALGYAE
jgi:hypothetical protein